MADSKSAGTVYERLLVGLVAIDLLFLPYLRFFVIPMSLPIAALVLIVSREKLLPLRDLWPYLVLLACIWASVWVGGLATQQAASSTADNIKRAGQLSTSFVYYFLLTKTRSDGSRVLKVVCSAFLLFQIALMAYHLASPVSLAAWEQSFYGNPAMLAIDGSGLLRYTYFFTDPNTAGYLVMMVAAYLLEVVAPRESAVRWMAVIAMLLAVFATASRGVMVAGLAVFAVHMWRTISQMSLVRRLAFVVLVLGVISTVSVFGLGSVTVNGRPVLAIERFSQAEFESGFQYRADKYLLLFSDYMPSLIGKGYASIVRPHSDILRMLYAYGLPAFLLLAYLLFRDIFRQGYAFVIPAFIAFSTNQLIDEQKLLVVFLVLLAVQRSRDRGSGRNARRRSFLPPKYASARVDVDDAILETQLR